MAEATPKPDVRLAALLRRFARSALLGAALIAFSLLAGMAGYHYLEGLPWLVAFTLILRRLRHPGIQAAGLTVLMRYTLRLLTLDQLGRAAALICALELERQTDPADLATLGDWSFEIGLSVGQAATPNRMGSKGDDNAYTARHKTLQFQRNDRNPAPIPLENCPWCGTKFTRDAFQLLLNPDAPSDLRVVCVNRACKFAARGGRFVRSRWAARVWRTELGFLTSAGGIVVVIAK